MTKLKERLQSLDVYDQMVCNCHQDSKLVQVSFYLVFYLDPVVPGLFFLIRIRTFTGRLRIPSQR
jgi:hypothetical protein